MIREALIFGAGKLTAEALTSNGGLLKPEALVYSCAGALQTISVETNAAGLDAATKDEIFALVETNMAQMYETSKPGSWNAAEKLDEVFSPTSKLLLARDPEDRVTAMVHFRFEVCHWAIFA